VSELTLEALEDSKRIALLLAAHERNQAEVVDVVNQMNALNEKLRTADKGARPELLRAWWRLKIKYDYLKWAIEHVAAGGNERLYEGN
jgi:hypothetical protein